MKRIVLPEVTQPKARMTDHLAGIEFLFTEKDAQKRALPAPLRPMNPTFMLSGMVASASSSRTCFAVMLRGLGDLQQTRHLGTLPRSMMDYTKPPGRWWRELELRHWGNCHAHDTRARRRRLLHLLRCSHATLSALVFTIPRRRRYHAAASPTASAHRRCLPVSVRTGRPACRAS